VGAAWAAVSVEELEKKIKGLVVPGATSKELVASVHSQMAVMIGAVESGLVTFREVAESSLAQMLGDAGGEGAEAYTKGFMSILAQLMADPANAMPGGGIDTSKIAAAFIGEGGGVTRVPAIQAIELLDELMADLRAKAEGLRDVDTGSTERTAGYEREAKGAGLLTKGMETLGDAFNGTLKAGQEWLAGTAQLDEYLLRLQEETRLTAASAKDREVLTAVLRAERIARQHNIELSGEYVKALEEEVRVQQMLREEREERLALEQQIAGFEFIPEGDVFGPLASDAALENLKKVREEVDLLADSIGDAFERGVGNALMHLDDLKGVAMSILRDIQKAFVDAFIREAGIKAFMSGLAGGFMGGAGPAAPAIEGFHGGLVGPGSGMEYMARGGITDVPTAVGMVGNRVAISSEFGQREFVMPAKRLSGGDMGVKVEMPDQGPRTSVVMQTHFHGVQNADEFQRAQRHVAANARRKLGRFQ